MKKSKIILNKDIAHIFIGVLIGVFATFLFMLLFALLLTMRDFDISAAATMSNISLAVGALSAGFVTTLLHKSKGLIYGAASGLILFAVMSIIALFVSGGSFSLNSLIRFAIMTVLSSFGGVIGVNLSAKHKMI